MKGTTFFKVVGVLLFLGLLTPLVHADAPNVLYTVNNLGIGGEGDDSFVGLFAGDDMLPYTDDDVMLDAPQNGEVGNSGGTWGFVHMDLNANNKYDTADTGRVNGFGDPLPEPIFVSVRNDDDDSTLFSAMNRPEYGVIYDGEDWVEYWEANQTGPTGTILSTDQTDFEINDWNGWTDESNAYVYNNLGANQHGLGYPKYRLDYRTTPAEGQDFVLDEIEGWQKSFGFRNTADDPNTPFNERGGCRRWFRAREEIDMRGYLIPVDDLEGLVTGSLPALFPDWMEGSTVNSEATDMASYFRDVIGPKLESEDLFIFTEVGLPLKQLLPLTHVYLMQYEVVLNVDNGEGECGGGDPPCDVEPDPALCQVQSHAGYWGIVPGTSKYRSSSIMGMNADLTGAIFGEGTHVWQDEPEDGAELNLWHQDHFWRDDQTFLGNYTCTPPGDLGWVIVPEPEGRIYDQTNDGLMVSLAAGAITAPLSKPLGAAEAPIIVVADLTSDAGPPPKPPAGAGGEPPPAENFQIVVHAGEDVVAYADIGFGSTQVTLGGELGVDGTASGGTGGDVGAGGEIAEMDTSILFAEYTRFIFVVNGDGASLHQEIHGDYETNSFLDLLLAEQLSSASHDGGGAGSHFNSQVTHVTISGNGKFGLNTFLVFASPGVGPFQRGDCNQDGGIDISDGIAELNWLFGGGMTPGCIAACDMNGDGGTDVSDPIYLLNRLFSGGPALPPPTASAAYSQRAEDGRVGCVDYSP